jgi:hypothetical protein
MDEETAPTFTGHYRGHKLHTHVPVNLLVYHFGPGENRTQMVLTAASASIWLSFTQKAAMEALKNMRLKIPGVCETFEK